MASILVFLLRKSFWAAATLSFFVSSIVAPSAAFAANRYWGGKSNTRWEGNNWSSTPRGATGATVPGVNDYAIFLGSGSTVNLRSAWAGSGILLSTTWTGSILMGTGTIRVGRLGIAVGSGRLIGGYAGSGVEIRATGSGYTQTGGVVSLAGPIILSGSWKVQSKGSTNLAFTSTGTLTFDNTSADQTFTTGQGQNRIDARYGSLTLDLTAGSTNDDLIHSGSTLSLSGALTITRGNLDLSTNSTALVVDDGAFTIANNAQSTFTTNSNVTHSGSLTANYLAGFTVSAGTWTQNGDNDATYTINGPAKRFFTLTLNNTGGGTNDDIVFAGSGVNLSGNLTITLGNMDLRTNNQAMIADDAVITIANAGQATFNTNANVTHSGSLTVNTSGGFTCYNGTWTVIDDSDTTYSMNGGGKRFYNLTLNNTAGASQDDLIITGTSLNMSGTLTVTRGKVDPNTNGLTSYIGSGVTIADNANSILSAGNMFVGGDWTRYLASIYTNNNGTVTFKGPGTQTISGSSIFAGLAATTSTARTIKFAKGEKQTVTNSLSLNGIASNKLSLSSTTSGTAWKIHPSGTRSVSYLTVNDSNNVGVVIACSDNCSDGGGNSNWDFTTASSSTSTTSSGGGGGGGGGRRTAAVAAESAATTTKKDKRGEKEMMSPKAMIKKGMTAKERMEARKDARKDALAKRDARKAARMKK